MDTDRVALFWYLYVASLAKVVYDEGLSQMNVGVPIKSSGIRLLMVSPSHKRIGKNSKVNK